MGRSDLERVILTREDIGYGPARPYEEAGREGMARERRESRRAEYGPEAGLGPYHQRLQRKKRPDPWIKADIEEALFLNTWIDAGRISVEVVDGVATLIGILPNREEIEEAVKDARGIPGVLSLRNLIEVET
jgi:hypothetical protein